MLWGANGASSANVPKHTLITNINPTGASVNNATMYTNTTPNAIVKNMVVGVYGVTPTEVTVANTAGKKDVMAGWVLRRSGMGPVSGYVMSNTGTGYSNNDQVTVKATACVNTAANVTTNSTGGIISLSNWTNGGGMFPNTASVTVAIANTTGGAANGSNFAATVTLGGRAGRHSNELLVSNYQMTGNSSQNTAAFPNA